MTALSSSGSANLRVLYVTYWGLLEPLGQALMLPPLRRFVQAGVRITLISFEKPHHLADDAAFQNAQSEMRALGITWLPQRYHQKPTAPATAWDVVIGCAYGVLKGLRERPDVVYARTYVGGLIGRQISRTLRRPLVFHNEGFWPDEQVDAGKWTSTSRPYRLCKQWENALYREADGIVTLSQWAQQKVIELRPHHAEETVVIVPSCVDLQQFSPLRDKEKAMAVADGCRLVYAGSLGGRYPVGEVAEFLKAARTIMPNSTLRLYSQQPYEEVAPEFEQRDISSEAWSVEFVHYSQVSQALGACHAGLHFLRPGINRRAGSPTKIGEYWACGLPVVTSPHVSDVDAIVLRERVGVLIAEDSTHAAEEAAAALKELLQDPELSLRCRYAAERYYNLESGVTKQINLFRHVMKLPAS